MNFTSTDPVEQFLIEVHRLCDRDGRIGGYRLGEDPPDELRIARILVAKIAAMEREACAKEAEDSDHVVLGRSYHDQLGDADATARNIAAAIRARGHA